MLLLIIIVVLVIVLIVGIALTSSPAKQVNFPLAGWKTAMAEGRSFRSELHHGSSAASLASDRFISSAKATGEGAICRQFIAEANYLRALTNRDDGKERLAGNWYQSMRMLTSERREDGQLEALGEKYVRSSILAHNLHDEGKYWLAEKEEKQRVNYLEQLSEQW